MPGPAPRADAPAPPSARRSRSAGRAAATESSARAAATSAGSISAMTTPGSVPPSARMRPQGSTTSEWPKVSRPFSCLPPCAAANTKQPFSIARARISTCQCASPVCRVKADGIARKARRLRPARDRARESAGRSRCQAEPAPRQVGDHGELARRGSCATRDSSRRRRDRRRTCGSCRSARRSRRCGSIRKERLAALSGETLIASEPTCR